jgi:hypothetical protein
VLGGRSGLLLELLERRPWPPQVRAQHATTSMFYVTTSMFYVAAPAHDIDVLPRRALGHDLLHEQLEGRATPGPRSISVMPPAASSGELANIFPP